jgi:hypothetical protein
VAALIEYVYTDAYFAYIYIAHVVDTRKDLPYTAGQEIRCNTIEMNRKQSSKSDRILSASEYRECDGWQCAYSQDPE